MLKHNYKCEEWGKYVPPMLATVALPVALMLSTPGPWYSIMAPVPPLTVRIPATLRMISVHCMISNHVIIRSYTVIMGQDIVIIMVIAFARREVYE